MKTIFAVFVFGLTSAASAQEYRQQQARAAEQAYEASQAAISGQAAAARRAAENAKVRSRTLEATLTRMRCGRDAGMAAAEYLDRSGIEVYFATQPQPVAESLVNGRTAITLSDALPPNSTVYAALIAWQAAKGMYADMPAVAERVYMRSATAARVFVEFDGKMAALPMVGQDKAEAVAAAVFAWKDDAQTALERAGQSEGVPELPELQEKASDPKTAAALEAANKRFTDFLLDEREARASAR